MKSLGLIKDKPKEKSFPSEPSNYDRFHLRTTSFAGNRT